MSKSLESAPFTLITFLPHATDYCVLLCKVEFSFSIAYTIISLVSIPTYTTSDLYKSILYWIFVKWANRKRVRNHREIFKVHNQIHSKYTGYSGIKFNDRFFQRNFNSGSISKIIDYWILKVAINIIIFARVFFLKKKDRFLMC